MIDVPVVLKENHIQLVTDQFGDIPSGGADGMGLYYYDTRYLSGYEVLVNGERPLYLSHSAERNYLATFQFVNSAFLLQDGTPVPRQSISIRRSRFVDDRAFHERLGFYNCNHFPVEIDVTIHVEADFRDIFAVRGFALQRLEGRTATEFSADEFRFSYTGRDKVARHTSVRFSQPGEPISGDTMLIRLRLEPHRAVSVTLHVQPSTGRRRLTALPKFDVALDRLGDSYREWNELCTRFETDNDFFDRSVLRQSRFDLRALLEFDDPGAESFRLINRSRRSEIVPSAGIPWYAVPFGRDSIITAYQTLMVNPQIAEGTLRFLARYQGTKVDEQTEEEPGKIFHELRRGELATLREIPHVPYFGTVDATPLFVILFVETMGWLDSDELYRDLLPNVLRALEWIDRYGDLDGDGYVEYIARCEGGVVNQGWKDSTDSLQYPDGLTARLPAALVEVQGYVYEAKMGLSRLVEARGDTPLAARLRDEAELLRQRFNRDFWMEDEQFFAQALDAEKRQVPSVTSNVGHCLWSEIVDNDRAPAVVRRLMADDMFSGWGIRTLSSASPNYNPMSYHNGSVWPHDNSLIALGMRRYGCNHEAATVIDAVIEAGLRFPINRLPELFCGFSRDRRFNSSPMSYIKSCSPQAWAAAAPFLFLQTLLGARPRDGGRTLLLDPVPNELFHRFCVDHLRTGAGVANFEVRSRPHDARIHLREGTVGVISPTAVVE